MGAWLHFLGTNLLSPRLWVAARPLGPPCPAAPPPAAVSVLAQVGRLYHQARATRQEHAGCAEALVDEWHRALSPRVGYGLHHEGLGLVSAGQLHQHNLVGELRRRDR